MKSYFFAKCDKNFVNLLPFLPTIKLTCGPKDTSKRLWHMKFLRQIFSIIPMSASFYNKMLQEKIILSLNIFILLKIEYFSLWAYNVSTLISYGICNEFMWNSLFSVATKFFLWVWVLWYWDELLILTHTELISKSALCVRLISSSSSSSETLLLVPAWLVVFFRLGPASSSPLRFDIAVFCSPDYTFIYA